MTEVCVPSGQSRPARKGTAPGTALRIALGFEMGGSADTVRLHVRPEMDLDGDRSTTRLSFDQIVDGDNNCRLLRSIQMGTQ